ncbi:MAG: UDP-glucose 4-epimerase GalE [Pseudomonadota bacterium]
MSERIVVTGGAGYIGAHVCVELLDAGQSVLVIDDLSNSSEVAIDRVRTITGKPDEITFAKINLADPASRMTAIQAIIDYKPTGAIHLAGLKAVGESVAEPVRYYDTNIAATVTLIKALEAAGAKSLVFYSSATVYGDATKSPVDETGQLSPTNPYGRTKYFIECILNDLGNTNQGWRICNLRYFNPVGAHPTGQIGEDPQGHPNNLFPFIAQVAVGRRDRLSVFGDNYPTPDGTGVRDYIHVVDLARGHVAALSYLARPEGEGCRAINLGAGKGYSVFEAVKAFEVASEKSIPVEVVDRRAGDIAEIYANATLAKELLGWHTEKDLAEMCADHWRWQRNNPNGYATPA